MYKKAWCTCKVVVLLIKRIVVVVVFFFLTFSLPSASLDLKVPILTLNGIRSQVKVLTLVSHFTQVRVQNIKRQLDATFLCSCWIESFHTKTLFPDDSVFNVYSKKSRGAI